MLFIGRGLVLGLTGGKTIAYDAKAAGSPFFLIGEANALLFNNQILVFLAVAALGALVLARTRWGYESYAVGGTLQAAGSAGIDTARVRTRGFLLASRTTRLAGDPNNPQHQGENQ